MSATPTVFHVNQLTITLTTNASFEEVGVWRESIAPARRLKAGSRERKSAGRCRKKYRKLRQQGSKMDVSGKKEQRKEIELDESWLKFTHEK